MLARDTDEDGGTRHLDRCEQVGDWRRILGEAELVLGEVRSAGDHQTSGVDEPAPGSGLRRRQPFLDHRSGDQAGDAEAGASGAVEQEGLVYQTAAGDAQRGQDPRERDSGRALDVVVEHAVAGPVSLQQPESIDVAEVLELDQGPWEASGNGLHELVQQRVVGISAHPLGLDSDVERVIEEIVVVGPDIDRDRQGGRGVDPSARRVQRELPDRDAHTVGTQVSEAEDALTVGDDDDADVVDGPVGQHLGNLTTVLDREVHAAGTAEHVGELLARLPDRRV